VNWPDENDRGLICPGATDILSVNSARPELVFLDALGRAIDTISPVLADADFNVEECKREFAAHWRQSFSSDFESVLLFSGSDQGLLTELEIRSPSKSRSGLGRRYIAYSASGWTDIRPEYLVRRSSEARDRMNLGKGCILSLPSVPCPPAPGEPLAGWWSTVLQQVSSSFPTLHDSGRKSRAKQFWIVGRCLPGDSETWFTLRCESKKKRAAPLHPSFLDGWTLTSHLVEPHTRQYLLPRAGSSCGLRERRAAVFGCGSVGSKIAEQLALAGVGELCLFDSDTFSSDNLYRHTLSMRFLGCNKADSLADALTERLPFTQTSGRRTRLLDVPQEDLSKFDLIFCATGNPTQELEFNRRCQEGGLEVPIVYTWVEALGIGGHAVLATGKPEKGCLACHHVDPETGAFELVSRLNFLVPGQAVARDTGGCGSLFLPYSSLDSSRTANLATRLGLQVLLGEIETGVARSWIGSSQGKDWHGFAVTTRFQGATEFLEVVEYRQQRCIVCGD
jgi:molybdopterin/thiamine biosynthesis adenylyltransferase